MPKFRKKPVVVEAIRYEGNGNVEGHKSPDWMWAGFADGTLRATDGSDPLIIKTLEGDMVVSPGDWIVQGTRGEIYPCKPGIFEETHELIE